MFPVCAFGVILCDQGFLREVTEGEVTLAISAFSPTHLGEFSLRVCSSRQVEVDQIPQEGAGMFAKVMRGEWCVFFFFLSHTPSCWPSLEAQLIKFTVLIYKH